MSYAISLNVCGGSQAEAATPYFVIGPIPDYKQAQELADLIYKHASVSSYLRDEFLTTVVEIFPPEDFCTEEAAAAAGELADNQVAISISAILDRMGFDSDYFNEED